MNITSLYEIYQAYPSVQTDTRKLKQGDLFFALKGPSFNGNAFAQQALDNGAAYAVVDEKEYRTSNKTILVDDALTALQDLALHHRRQLNIPFLSITGSNGKTTTKELIHAVLATTFNTYTTEGNLNNHIGVPLTILKIRTDAEMAVIEMGANHLGEIASYCRIAEPTHGLITNIGKAHLEGFGSAEGVRKGKGELFDYLALHNGTVFIMHDFNNLREMGSAFTNAVFYGSREGDVTGDALSSSQFLSVGFTKGLSANINTQLVGEYNLPNVLAAAAVGKYFKVPDEKIAAALEAYSPNNSRSQLVKKKDLSIILDAYNANPSSMKVAVDNFARLECGEKVLILGAMAELGQDSITEHKELVDQIAQTSWSQVVLVGGDFLKVDHGYLKFETAPQAGEWLAGKINPQACLLIKGSRSMQMEKILDYL